MPCGLSKYQQGGILAFIILSLCITVALYRSDQASKRADEAIQTSEENRYDNCKIANEAIQQLNRQVKIQKEAFLIATETLTEEASNGNIRLAQKIVRFGELDKKLVTSKELECIPPK